MKDFVYGQRDPKGLVGMRRSFKAIGSVAEHYLDHLLRASKLHERGNADLVAGLTLFDREVHNIRAGWSWACKRKLRDSNAAILCRDYANAEILQFRLPAQDRIALLEAAISACRRLRDRRGEAMSIGRLGIAYLDAGDSTSALRCQRIALGMAKRLKDRSAVATELINLGAVHFHRGDVLAAVRYYEEAMPLVRKFRRPILGTVLANLGLCYLDLQKHSSAIRHLQRALSRQKGHMLDECRCLNGLGLAYLRSEEFRMAIQSFKRVLRIARRISNPRSTRDALGNLGATYFEMRDIHKSIEYHCQSLTISRAIADPRGESVDLGNLGKAYAILQNYTKAEECFRSQMALARRVHDRRLLGSAAWNMARLCDETSKQRDAIRYARQALAIREALGDPRARAVRGFLDARLNHRNQSGRRPSGSRQKAESP
jgi:tetratricopeptide (TPR) repeat protein